MSMKRRLELAKQIEILRRKRDRSNDLEFMEQCMNEIGALKEEHSSLLQSKEVVHG